MGRDITEEVENETGSAGPAYTNQDFAAQQMLSRQVDAVAAERQAALWQVGRYEPSPEEKAKQQKHEEEYMRREIINGLVPFLGGNKDALLATARDVAAFIKNG